LFVIQSNQIQKSCLKPVEAPLVFKVLDIEPVAPIETAFITALANGTKGNRSKCTGLKGIT